MTTPQWIPAEVLQLNPNSSGFTCIGYAASKGRRCRNPIACANRQESANILLQMSRLDPQSQRLDNKLGELASRLLCRRWHQDQAAEMKRQWQRNIESYQAAESARRSERILDLMELLLTAAIIWTERPSTVRTPAAPARSTIAQPRATSLRTDRTASLVAQLRIHGSSSVILSMATREESGGRENNEPNGEESGQQTDRELDSPSQQEALLPETNHRENNSTPISSADELMTHIPGTSLQEPTAATREDVADARESEEHVLEAPTEQRPREESLHAHDRRAIEGDCSICYEDFNSSGAIAWCRAQCGQNFHTDCINLWHASQVADRHMKTCPYCRTEWAE